jgi:hypothetical protein
VLAEYALICLSGVRAFQGIEQWELAGQNSCASFGETEPGGSIDLREHLDPAASGRPLQFKAVADDTVSIEVPFERKGFNPFSAFLADSAERLGSA